MSHAATVKRYIVFLLGVLVCATGIAFITRAGLGTSPVSSVPFVLSLVVPEGMKHALTMGVFTFVFNMLFLVGEAVLVRRFTVPQALQIPATLFFSFCIDTALSIIPSQYNGGSYAKSLLYLAVGCVVMALGISLEVLADVIMLPAEAFVRALSKKLQKEFGNVKVCFDSSITVIAGSIALFAFHKLNGVREGTLVSSLLVGQLVKVITRRLSFLKRFFDEKPSHSSDELTA